MGLRKGIGVLGGKRVPALRLYKAGVFGCWLRGSGTSQLHRGQRSMRGLPIPTYRRVSLCKEGAVSSHRERWEQGVVLRATQSIPLSPHQLPLTASILMQCFSRNYSVRDAASFPRTSEVPASKHKQVWKASFKQDTASKTYLKALTYFFPFNGSLFNPPAGKQPNLWCTASSGRKPPYCWSSVLFHRKEKLNSFQQLHSRMEQARWGRPSLFYVGGICVVNMMLYTRAYVDIYKSNGW